MMFIVNMFVILIAFFLTDIHKVLKEIRDELRKMNGEEKEVGAE